MTGWEAEQRIEKSREKGRSPVRFLWVNLIFRPIATFFLRYIRQGGWREGYRGLILSMIWSFYVAITYMRVWENELDLPDTWWMNNAKQEKDTCHPQ